MRNLLTTAAILALGLGLSPAGAQEIGAAAAVNSDIDSSQPSAPTRSLLLGDRLISNERLVSSASGSGQMLFLDQTSLTVSPNSDITLDKYVYDPNADSGSIGLTVARGALRMVGGRITKSSDGEIRTPTATIGIRGGIVLVAVEPGGLTHVIHIAGEYTRIVVNGTVLNLTRANAYATVAPGGEPEYQGVATPAQIAGFFNSMQGGGGGSQVVVTPDGAEQSDLAALNSEIPGIAFQPPISTAGERPAHSNDIEVEQLTLAAQPDVTRPAENLPPEEPVAPPPPVNPYANFIGGFAVAGAAPFTDGDGNLIANPAQQNFLFVDQTDNNITLFEPGSLILTLENGDRATLPTPASSGFFNVAYADTDTPVGQLSGAGYADFEAGLLLYGLRSRGGDLVGVFGANPGPTQLRNYNLNGSGFGVASFELFPDLAISAPGGTAQAFLPAGLGEIFDSGQRTQAYLIARPGQPLYTGTAADYSAGARLLLPQFAISGTGENQRYLFHVGATGIANNGVGAPTFFSFGRGSFRLDPFGAATELRPAVGTTQIGNAGRTLFGAGDQYMLLGNEAAFALNDDLTTETAASRFNRIGAPEGGAYGNLHLARRNGAEQVGAASRIQFGAAAAAYRSLNPFFASAAPNNTRYLSLGYASGAGALMDASGQVTEKYVFRGANSSSFLTDTGAAAFSTRDATGAIVVDLSEVYSDNAVAQSIFAARLFFGGNRSAVIDQRRFGMRDHQDPTQLTNILVQDFPDENANSVLTSGPVPILTGRAPDAGGQTAFRGGMIGHELVRDQVASLYPTGTPLSPNYLSWGWWTGQFRFADNDPEQFQNARLQFGLGTWIAGNPTAVLPASGTASYAGAVTVNNLLPNGADYVDGGRFNMNFDFGNRTGNALFRNVLSLPNFSVPVDANSGGFGRNHYGGLTQINPGGPNPTLAIVDGSFFDGPQANDARATAGSIRLQNNSGSINATGTYWGER